MLVLAIDTSSAAVTAALFDVSAGEFRQLAERVQVNARGHAELLAPAIADCLTDAGSSAAELGAVVAGVGPGPFTGLRVGLVTAAVLAETLGIPTYGVCSLDGIAGRYGGDGWSTGPDPAAGPLLAVADARRKEVYWATYRDGARIAGPEVSRPADLPNAKCAVGAGAVLYADVLRGKGIPVLAEQYPSAAALVRGARDRLLGGEPSEPLTPLYLRRPDAIPPGTAKAVTA